MAMANMNLIGVFVTKLWPVQALACGGGRDGGGSATKNIRSPKFSNFGDIIMSFNMYFFVRCTFWCHDVLCLLFNVKIFFLAWWNIFHEQTYFFEILTYFLTYAWHTSWCHDAFLMLWHTFDVIAYFVSSWHTSWRHAKLLIGLTFRWTFWTRFFITF